MSDAVQRAGKALAAAALRVRTLVPRKCAACGKPCSQRTHTKVEFTGFTCVAVDVWFVCGPKCAEKLEAPT